MGRGEWVGGEFTARLPDASLPRSSPAAVWSTSGLGEERGREGGERVKPGEGRPENRRDHGGVGGSWPWSQCFLIRAGRTMRWGGQWGEQGGAGGAE